MKSKGGTVARPCRRLLLGVLQREDKVFSNGLRTVAVENTERVGVGQRNLLRRSDSRKNRLSDRALDHRDGLDVGRQVHRAVNLHAVVRVDALDLGLLAGVVQIHADAAVEVRAAHDVNHVTLNTVNVVVGNGLDGLDKLLKDVLCLRGRRSDRRTSGSSLIEEVALKLASHGALVHSGLTLDEVVDAVQADVLLLDLGDKLLVRVDCDGDRLSLHSLTLAAAASRAVSVGLAVHEALRLNGTSARRAGQVSVLQLRRNQVLLDVADDLAVLLSEELLAGRVQKNVKCVNTCHS